MWKGQQKSPLFFLLLSVASCVCIIRTEIEEISEAFETGFRVVGLEKQGITESTLEKKNFYGIPRNIRGKCDGFFSGIDGSEIKN